MEALMQRPVAAVPLSCLALLSATTLLVVGGCTNAPTSQLSSTQGTGAQETTTQGTNTCTHGSTPYISLLPYAVGVKPGASFIFSATANNVGDCSVTWSIKEGPTGGVIT